MMETEALRSLLRDALVEYRSQRPHLSIRAIAKNTGVDRYFLGKILEESSGSSKLDLNKVLILLKGLSKETSLKSAIDSQKEPLKKELMSTFSVLYNSDKVLSKEIESLNLFDYDEYLVLVLATFDTGTTRESVGKILGEKGLTVLDRYLEDEILIEKFKKIKLASGVDFFTTLKLLKFQIGNYARFYNPAHAGKNRNYIHVSAQGVTLKALREAVKLHRDLHEKMTSLINNPQNFGDIPFFSVGLMDTFTDLLPLEHTTPKPTPTATSGETIQ